MDINTSLIHFVIVVHFACAEFVAFFAVRVHGRNFVTIFFGSYDESFDGLLPFTIRQVKYWFEFASNDRLVAR